MSATVTKTPVAYRDLDGIANYIQQRNPDAAHRFLIVAEKAFHLLASQPLLGEVYLHPKISRVAVLDAWSSVSQLHGFLSANY